MKKYKLAAILMIIHGGFMELGGVFAMIPALLWGTDKFDIGKYFEFRLPYFQENIYMMMVMGALYGVLRMIGAVYGWNSCRQCVSIDLARILWEEKDNGINDRKYI